MGNVTTVGLDLAKNVFQVHGVGAEGAAVIRQRLTRGRMLKFFAKLPPCLIGTEACATSHYWARELMALGHPTQWRQRAELAGGGSLPDVGLYCLNVARAVAGADPVEVAALVTTPAGDARFDTVEDQVTFTLRFPGDAMASCVTGYDAHKLSRLIVSLQDGWIELENAFDYVGARLRVARRAGEREHIVEVVIPEGNQFALEVDHFASCIRAGRYPDTPGELGLQDQQLISAIYQAARERRTISVG